MDPAALARLQFNEQGLIPAVVQDWRDGTVLMVAYMNREALEKTLATGIAHFWSRSRQTLWEKGATSGHRQRVRDLFLDCDQDTLLITVMPEGPACHTGARSCFFSRLAEAPPGGEGGTQTTASHGGVLDRLYETIEARQRHAPAGSYVGALLAAGQEALLSKVTEEAGELVLASKGQRREEIVHEAADLLFHLLVTLGYHAIPPAELYQELARRFGQSGIQEKASRKASKAEAPHKR